MAACWIVSFPFLLRAPESFRTASNDRFLAVGIYSLTWVFQTMYHTLPREQRKAPSAISAHMSLYHLTGADEATTILLTFPTTTPTNNAQPGQSQAVAMTHLRVATDPNEQGAAGPSIRIQGTKGEIQVFGPAFRPERYRLIPKKGTRRDQGRAVPVPGGWEGHVLGGRRGGAVLARWKARERWAALGREHCHHGGHGRG